MRAPSRHRSLIAAALLLSACGGESTRAGEVTPADVIAGAVPVFDHFTSASGQFTIDFPEVWRGHYTVVDRPDTTAGARSATEFTFRPPVGSKVPPKTLMVLRQFTAAAWEKVAARPGQPVAAKVAAKGDVVFALSLPADNPYQKGTSEAKLFDTLVLAVVQDPAGLRLTPR